MSAKQTLIVVSKNEVAVNLLRKIIERCDINPETGERVYPETDIVYWDQKVWLENKKPGNISEKVLFIGSDIKGVKKLIPVIDVEYDQYGVKFGWAGNQGLISVDTKPLARNKELYSQFLEEINSMKVPNGAKESKKTHVNFGVVAKDFFFPPAAIVDGVISNMGMHDQMIMFGVCKFCEEGFNTFMS